MSRIAALVNQKHIAAVKKFHGDEVIFRAKGDSGFVMTAVFSMLDVVSFSGSAYDSQAGPVSSVDSQQPWFLLFRSEFGNRPGPKIDDEIVFEQRSYSVVQVQDETYDKMWVRVQENELGLGAFREF